MFVEPNGKVYVQNKWCWRGGSPQYVYANFVAPSSPALPEYSRSSLLSPPCSLSAVDDRSQLVCPPRLLSDPGDWWGWILWWKHLVRSKEGLSCVQWEIPKGHYRKIKASKQTNLFGVEFWHAAPCLLHCGGPSGWEKVCAFLAAPEQKQTGCLDFLAVESVCGQCVPQHCSVVQVGPDQKRQHSSYLQN